MTNDFDEFLGEDEEELGLAGEAQDVAPDFFVEVSSVSGGGSRIVPLETAETTISVLNALAGANIRVATNYEYYVDNVMVDVNHMVGNGALVTVIESVKGG